MQTYSDVTIIGAGPTGLMLANLLGRAGVTTRIFERRSTPFTEPRAIAYDPETLRLFQAIGCFKELSKTLMFDVPVHYVNENGKTLTHITDCPPAFGHSGRGTYYQPELEHTLLEGLQQNGLATLVRGAEVIDVAQNQDSVSASISQAGNHLTHQSKYLIDCSGGASHIRRKLGIDFDGSTFKEKWLVIDIKGDDYPDPTIKFFCDPRRPAVTLPVSNNRRRWEFLVMPGDDEQTITSESNVRKLMSKYGAGNATEIERSLVYTFHARFAAQFRSGNVFLAGDSAHVMPPFAGQGLNSGMRDAANLAWKLTSVLRESLAPELLESYETERRPHVQRMSKLAIFLGKIVMPTSRRKAWLRDQIMLNAWRSRAVRRRVNRGDVIPKPSIAGSPLVNWKRRGDVGKMIEQPRILRNGESVLLDEILGQNFAVIALNCSVEKMLHTSDLTVLKILDATFCSLSTKENNLLDGLDTKAVLRRHTVSDQAIIVVRPDKFIIDCFSPTPERSQLAWMNCAYGMNG